MTDPTALRVLAARIQAGESCDEDVALALGWECAAEGSRWWHDPALAPDGWRLDFPTWLTSLDAAVTLAPEGWTKMEMGADDRTAWAVLFHDRYGDVEGRGKKPAAALTAAALLAMAWDGEQKEPDA